MHENILLSNLLHCILISKCKFNIFVPLGPEDPGDPESPFLPTTKGIATNTVPLKGNVAFTRLSLARVHSHSCQVYKL